MPDSAPNDAPNDAALSGAAAGSAPDAADADILSSLARVPEHSVRLMRAASGGEPFTEGDHLFLAADDWLIGIGHPLRGGWSARAFEDALSRARKRSGATRIQILAPRLPARLLPHAVEADRYYVVAAGAPIPAKLRGPVERARAVLRLEIGRTFTPAHRRLWGEFLGRATPSPQVRLLYARIEALLAEGGVHLLEAWDDAGHLVACMAADSSPARFDSYILGAHSRERYVPHASDLLMAELLRRAGERGKRIVHLGLGVNAGITRFKLKWGGRPAVRCFRAAWEERASDAMRVIIGAMRADADSEESMRLEMEHAASQRPFRMLWKLEKNGRTSWIGGTAHFFRHSFESAFRALFRNVDTVLFEGHLDDDSFAAVAERGRRPPDPGQCVADLLTEEEIRRLERVVRGPEGPLWRFLNMEAENKADVRWHLRRTRPWFAFFSLWTAYLERRGWRNSVDLEACRTAHRMGKRVLAMEDIDEQVEALEAVPAERAARHFRKCREWDAYLRATVRAYLAGDLEGMMGLSAEFPTRSELIIHERDRRFLERMAPYLERGRCCAFVGTAHMLGLRGMLADAGFTLTPVRQGWRPLGERIREALRGDAPVDPSGGLHW